MPKSQPLWKGTEIIGRGEGREGGEGVKEEREG